MTSSEPLIGKYKVIQTRILRNGEYSIPTIILTTDNCREAVWVANKDPHHLTTVHVCGERDFYQDDEYKWHSFEL